MLLQPMPATTGYYLPDRKPGPVTEVLCWSHAKRKFFLFADIAANLPNHLEAVKHIDLLLTSSATSIDQLPSGALTSKQKGVRRSSPNWKDGCLASRPGSRATHRSPRRSIACSCVGQIHRHCESSRTAALTGCLLCACG